ncbi:MAG: alpha/beta fold hydrolase [Opitutales bacterium]|nr:alpha/beta fold hydrolase [Opitutales bacterium]
MAILKTVDTFGEMYPFDSNYSVIDSSGNRVHYIQTGKGETVLFLHGFPSWSFMYRDLIKELRSEFSCVALDHLGYGFSDKPLHYKYNIENHIKNAIKFAENMQFRKFHLVMHDFGVAVGLAMAERWPERISSMVFLNSSCFRYPKFTFTALIFKLPILRVVLTRFTNFLQKIYLHLGAETMTPEIEKGYLWPYHSFLDRVAIGQGLNDIPLFPDHKSLPKYDELESKAFLLSNKKMKFFWADLDFFHTSASLKRWAKILPNAYLKRYENGNYFLLEDSAAARNDICAFLLKHRNISKFLFN